MNPLNLVPVTKEFLLRLKWERFVKKQKNLRDEFWTSRELHKALLRNGVIIERARQEHRSLTYIERQIISAIRDMAKQMYSTGNRTMDQIQRMINLVEMEGERDKETVFQPIKVKAKFAYFNSGEYGYDPQPSYHITESNHPALPTHGNVGREELEKNGVKVPSTPTFDKWVAKGRKVFRG